MALTMTDYHPVNWNHCCTVKVHHRTLKVEGKENNPRSKKGGETSKVKEVIIEQLKFKVDMLLSGITY
uniref:Uncharacterized protein n=1 Tax=Cucumis melo TaxID=3656 RepID=A0A9I9E4F8_CUCME